MLCGLQAPLWLHLLLLLPSCWHQCSGGCVVSPPERRGHLLMGALAAQILFLAGWAATACTHNRCLINVQAPEHGYLAACHA